MLCSIYAFLVQTQTETRAQAFDPEPLCSLSSSSSFPKLSPWLSSQRRSDYDSWCFSSHRCTRSIHLILICKAFVVGSLSLPVVLSKDFSCFEARLVLYSHISHLKRNRNSHYYSPSCQFRPKCCCFLSNVRGEFKAAQFSCLK